MEDGELPRLSRAHTLAPSELEVAARGKSGVPTGVGPSIFELLSPATWPGHAHSRLARCAWAMGIRQLGLLTRER